MATPDTVVAAPDARAVERVSALDLMQLASDAGAVPNQVGAVLVLDARGVFDAEAAVALLGERIQRVPRLRQRQAECSERSLAQKLPVGHAVVVQVWGVGPSTRGCVAAARKG